MLFMSRARRKRSLSWEGEEICILALRHHALFLTASILYNGDIASVPGTINDEEPIVVEIMRGIRVLEVASWTYVPVAGAVLAEWGADVIKVEHPDTGDPQRGLVTSGLVPLGGVAHMVELPNRGKRSVALDMKSPEGHELLLRLAETADVFLTNFLPNQRKKLRIDVEDIRAVNPRVIFASGSAHGPPGPDADTGGHDNSTLWAPRRRGRHRQPGRAGLPGEPAGGGVRRRDRRPHPGRRHRGGAAAPGTHRGSAPPRR